MDLNNPFGLNPLDTCAAFIDGPGLYWAYKALQTDDQLDMLAIKRLLDKNSRLQSVAYYTVLPPRERRDANGFTPIKPLADMLGYAGFRVHTKEAYTYPTDLGTRVKGSINLELGLDAFEAATLGMNHVVLFTNDDDFLTVVQRLQDRACRVTVVSTEKNQVVSDDLRWATDNFVDLDNIKSVIGRPYRRDDAKE